MRVHKKYACNTHNVATSLLTTVNTQFVKSSQCHTEPSGITFGRLVACTMYVVGENMVTDRWTDQVL